MPNPKSTVSIAGHPLHPMLVPFPIAFFVRHSYAIWHFGEPQSRFGLRHHFGFWVLVLSWRRLLLSSA
jgi:uncharacterized membrane protein